MPRGNHFSTSGKRAAIGCVQQGVQEEIRTDFVMKRVWMERAGGAICNIGRAVVMVVVVVVVVWYSC